MMLFSVECRRCRPSLALQLSPWVPSAIILIVLIIIISSIILVYLIHFDIYVNHYVIDAICGIYSISVSSGCSCDIIFRFYHHNYYF